MPASLLVAVRAWGCQTMGAYSLLIRSLLQTAVKRSAHASPSNTFATAQKFQTQSAMYTRLDARVKTALALEWLILVKHVESL